MIMNDKVYDILKWIAQIVLPAVSTLYLTLSGMWGVPYGEQVAGTIAAIDTCLGVFLGISASKYYKAQDAENTQDGE